MPLNSSGLISVIVTSMSLLSSSGERPVSRMTMFPSRTPSRIIRIFSIDAISAIRSAPMRSICTPSSGSSPVTSGMVSREVLRYLVVHFVHVVAFERRERDSLVLREGVLDALDARIFEVGLVSEDEDWEVLALDDTDEHGIDLREGVGRAIQHVDDALHVLPKPVHRLRDTLGGLAGATYCVLFLHVVVEELLVIDFGLHARRVYDVDRHRLAVALDFYV